MRLRVRLGFYVPASMALGVLGLVGGATRARVVGGDRASMASVERSMEPARKWTRKIGLYRPGRGYSAPQQSRASGSKTLAN